MPPQAQAVLLTPLPVGTSIAAGTLRAEMESRRAAGRRFDVKEAIGVVVPLCTQLADLHAHGKTLFVHPSSLRLTAGGAEVVVERAHAAPTLPRDRACLAPEERKGVEGDARASVFTIGAILYELLTNTSVGPGMRRPGELVPDLSKALEQLLGKALVVDPKHRPGDLAALAQALHMLAPGSSIEPPAADLSHLDGDESFEVDVSLSMIPPSPTSSRSGGGAIPPPPSMPTGIVSVQGEGPYAVAIPAPRSRSSNDPTQRLSDLKAALESDPRPRYVVVKEGMDHGPFSAVELLQQIASGSFTSENVLRDAFVGGRALHRRMGRVRPVRRAHQAEPRHRSREARPRRGGRRREEGHAVQGALVGVALVGVFAAGAAGWWYRERSSREHALDVHSDSASAVDVDGGLSGPKSAGGGSPHAMGGPTPGGGSYPVLGGGMSCEGAQSRYVEEYKINGNNGPPDLTAGAYGAVLNRGSYLNACGVPPSTAVNVCAAVQNGRAVGVTVTTTPHNAGVNSCIAGAIRSLPFPSHPRLDVARTSFAAQ